VERGRGIRVSLAGYASLRLQGGQPPTGFYEAFRVHACGPGTELKQERQRVRRVLRIARANGAVVAGCDAEEEILQLCGVSSESRQALALVARPERRTALPRRLS